MTPTNLPEGIPIGSYDRIIVAFSGGKDSVACFLHLLDLGVPTDRIELWHHDIDGREGDAGVKMDWPVTASYCHHFATHFDVPLYFSWKEGGFHREMMRDGDATAPTLFETPAVRGGIKPLQKVGGEGNPGTRLRFPQVSADLNVRWCSAYLKIDVMAAAIRNQDRFIGTRTLVITGERALESAARAKYRTFEPHRADNRDGKRRRRHVDHWRPIHAWNETAVWGIIQRYKINPHPAYRLGWGRVSCMLCIFGNKDQWASLALLSPARFNAVAEAEEAFGCTIQRGKSVRDLAASGQPYHMGRRDRRAATSHYFGEPIVLDTWTLPAGAYGDSCGPT